MKRRLLTALAVSALIVSAAAPAATSAAGPKREFRRLNPASIDKSVVQKLLASRDVDVIVELGDAPATLGGHTNAQQQARAKNLKLKQKPLEASIKKLGGKVQASYQYALNGLKVHIPSRKVNALAKLPGVVAIKEVPTYKLDNVHSVPFIAAHAVWQDYGDTGQGQTIAVIDTGIDYTHANFGGPGTEAAYDDNDSTIIEDGTFPTAKVIDGWDFVGDDYNPENTDGTEVPAPDPDPLDCFGHGSHVAGTAAGFGVKSDHTTYTGAYGTSTYATSFAIGPGVAPKAKLIALKVFGCDGGTNVLTDALEWVATYNATHADAIDVVNMSIGGIGGDYTADAQASDALVADGVSVVASAGNEGPNAYMTGSPGNATGVISVAASDVTSTFPGATIDRATPNSDINGINENAYPGLPVSGTLVPILDDGATADVDEHLGCTESDYGDLAEGSIAVIQRGVCTFVEKGAAAEAAGAVGVIVVNRDDIADPNEVPTFIGYTPTEFDIPMIGVGRASKATLFAADGQAATLKAGPSIANSAYLANATFSSGGPRLGDSAQKPDVSAPGVNIISTGVGLGYKGTTLSGTSMAAPHVAGVAALVRQAHPNYTPEQVKSVIVGTAVQTKVKPYNSRIAGSGMVQPRRAVDAVVYAIAQDGTASLSFGYDPLRSGTYTETKSFTLYNRGPKSEVYTLTTSGIVKLNKSSVTIPAHGSVTVQATASLTAAQLAASKSASQVNLGGTAWGSIMNWGGIITATPKVRSAGRYPITVVWRAVPRAESNIVPSARTAWESDAGISSASVTLRNNGIHNGIADVYAWGLSDPKDMPSAITATNDIRAVGLQVLPAEVLTGDPDDGDRGLIFAINTYGRWSGGFQNVFEIDIYGDGEDPEFSVLSFDFGLLTAGDLSGQVVSLIVDAEGNVVDLWQADAPANGSTILLPLLASDIDRTAADATVDYEVFGDTFVDSSDLGDGLEDVVAGRASVSVFAPAVSTGDFLSLDPGESTTLDLLVDEEAQADNPAKGWMVVTLDDANGAAQADLLPADAPLP